MIVFLDFEASSLNKTSFPIEIAWVFEDGSSRSALIRLAPDWTDWSAKAEAIHGISRELLLREGVPVKQLANEMLLVLSDHDLYASAPSWDGKWLSTLLRQAGLPRHALKLRKSDDAFQAAARAILGEGVSQEDIAGLVEDVVERTGTAGPPAHRALPDAQLEFERWTLVREAACERASARRR